MSILLDAKGIWKFHGHDAKSHNGMLLIKEVNSFFRILVDVLPSPRLSRLIVCVWAAKIGVRDVHILEESKIYTQTFIRRIRYTASQPFTNFWTENNYIKFDLKMRLTTCSFVIN